ncbi:hypothetical protein POX_d06037 [Penicillium oxalicum]|uniref:hypothetical protein n=1 Tax=Penicillium oxalicum TaxID=69781 RepID=UPI0020B63947|nr:hypothetical protein POX_d06037 [Penicillium oxalicum]KAI2790520.1 hypothetical protein POX_d06037 [Penicillium oxalicum]
MATPPPEAPAALKQEKPQLPPSPTGGSGSELAPSSALTSTSPKLKPEDPAEMDTSTLTTNGDKSHTPHPLMPATGDVPASIASTSIPPSANQESKLPSEPAASVAAHTLPLSTASVATNGSAEGTEAKSPRSSGNLPTGSQDSKDGIALHPTGAKSPLVKTELPHHPSADSVATGMIPAHTDHEMKDAPTPTMSSSKISREREVDPVEEPAAKRTKVENGNSTSTNIKTEADSTMTKLQHKFITRQIAALKRAHDSRFYRVPVDPVTLNIPNYPMIIDRPMDLGTIERKLKNQEYSTAQEVRDDFSLMVENAVRFNGPDHLVAQEGVKLRTAFERLMIHLPRPDEVEEKKKAKKSGDKASAARRDRTSMGSQAAAPAPRAPVPPPAAPKAPSPQSSTFALGPEGLPVIRRDSANADGRPKRSIHPPKRDLPYSTKPKKKKYQWELRFCQEALEELYKPKYQDIALAFYLPVDPVALNIPTYHSVIKHPMDLSTIKAKLATGQYENAKEFHSDVKLMFRNCYRFNLQGDPTWVAGKSLEEVFDKKWSTKQEYLTKHEPPPEQNNSESSEEESEEEAEESDEDNEKLLALQRQIAEMSRQVEMIQKKKKTPPAKKVSKSGKTTVKKEAKKPSGKKDKKPKTLSKPEKTRNISYHEKQIISNGISSLPDKKMQEALSIIQQNVPALKGTQEAEIELDIDELPNDVLLMLLKFVKKNVPHILDDEEPAPVGLNVAPAAPKPKKNKPMSKYEQEAQINMLESNLSRFQGGSGSPNPMPSVEANESSDDESDDDSEESEEE